MPFMWIVGPILVALVWVLTGRRDRRREVEVERWRRSTGLGTLERRVEHREADGYRSTKEIVDVVNVAKKRPEVKLVGALPGPLQRMADAAGGGDAFQNFELVPKLAYLAVMSANVQTGSDHQTVAARLDDAAPSFTVRPLPIVEGERAANTGVQFKKDPEFMALFLVESSGALLPATTAPAKGAAPASTPTEAEVAKKIRGWLSRPVREALRDLPEAWLRVQGKTMALTVYGAAPAEKINELVTVADAIFAEYGAEGGPSLFGDAASEEDEDEEAEAAPPPPPPPAPKKTKKPAAAKATAKG